MRPLIAGNWKMHGDMTWIEKPEAFNRLYPAIKRPGIDVLICPPSLYIAPLVKSCQKADVFLGAQNCHAEIKGAHTGEISAEMLADIGANYVILGHSERRTAGETDSEVKAKSEAAIRAKITPIICVGETLSQREAGQAKAIVESQIKASLPEKGSRSLDIVIAYEPVWAIGTGKTATPDDIDEMHKHISQLTQGRYRLLYGGSVKPGNAKEILAIKDVHGALIGGASLNMEDFVAIAKSA